MHADFLVLYKVRHQRLPRFTCYTVYTYKTTEIFKCIKAVYESAYNRYWSHVESSAFRLEYRSSSATVGSLTNPLQ